MRLGLLKIKNILFITGSGFIFSFLTGLLSGNPFVIIVKRAILGSVFFTLIITAAYFVLKKVIPDMDSGLKAYDADLSDQKTGGNIDIVLDDENTYEAVNVSDDDMVDDRHSDDDLLEKDFVEEVEEDAIDDIDILKNVDDSEEVIEVMNDRFDNNSLPELDEHASFISGSSDNTIGGGDNKALNMLGGNVDPGSMAKAIKTILKKDQEG